MNARPSGRRSDRGRPSGKITLPSLSLTVTSSHTNRSPENPVGMLWPSVALITLTLNSMPRSSARSVTMSSIW